MSSMFAKFQVANAVAAKPVTEADLFDAETGFGAFERAESGLTIVKTDFVLADGSLYENVGLGEREWQLMAAGRCQYAGNGTGSLFETYEGQKFLPMTCRGGKVRKYYLAPDGVDHVGEPLLSRGALRGIRDFGVNKEALLNDGTLKELPSLQARLLRGEEFDAQPANNYEAGIFAMGMAMQLGFWPACHGQLWHFAKGDIAAPELGGVHFLQFAAHVAQNRSVVLTDQEGEHKSRAYTGAQPGMPNSRPHMWWNKKVAAMQAAGLTPDDLLMVLC